MALNLKFVMEMEGRAAKAEVDAMAGSIKGVSTASGELTTKSRAAAGAAAAEAAARQRAAVTNRAYAASAGQAAAATGNLVGQFNDIGMMLAAGQNPLQLAIQQGTQITQVFGNQGAAGAASLLRASLVQMLNPVNLFTVAAIAAGATMVNWLLSADEKAGALEARLKGVADATTAVADANADVQTEIDKLRFGVDESYQVELLREQLQLRREYNAKVGELNAYLANTPDSIDRQRISAAALTAEIGLIADRYNAITATLSDQQNRSVQLAILKGIEAQRAAELEARERDAAAAGEELLAAAKAVGAALASASRADLSAVFERAFPTANALLGITNNIVTTLNAGIAQANAAAASRDRLGQMAVEFSPGGQNMLAYGGRTPGGTSSQNALAARNRPLTIADGDDGGGGGGGGGGAAKAETNALQDLISTLEDEITALRVQDPIQQEMLKHRQALTGATEAERQKVEELIIARERERAAIETAKSAQEFFESTAEDALEALIVKGESLNDVLRNVAASLAKAAIQAAIFGTGPLGGLFGGKGIGSILFGGILGAGKAAGGMIHGPGTGTSDSVLTPTSNGEFIVNARATARNRHALEAINAGATLRGYAEGGVIGSDNRRGAARDEGRGGLAVHISLAGARGDREIEQASFRGTKAALQEYDRYSLPASVKRISGDQKRIG